MARARDHGGGRCRGWLLAGWAAGVVAVLTLNVAWPLPGREDEWPWVTGLMAFPVAAAVVLAQRPGNVIGRLLATVGTSAGAIFALSWYVQALPDAPLSRQLEALEAIPAVLQFGGILGLLNLFPTGRPLHPVHGRLVATLWWCTGLFAVLGVVAPGPLTLTGRPNPFGLGPPWLRTAWDSGAAALLPFLLIGVWAVVARWRDAGVIERAQLKWFYAGALWMTLVVFVVVIPPEDPRPQPLLDAVGGVLVATAFWTLPLAVMVAVTRYRLFDIDRVISRTVAYTLIVGVIGLVYVASVVGLQALLPIEGSDLAIAASTLAAATAFRPLRHRIQRAVDRRFNRARYEVGLVAAAFAEQVRREIDVEVVTEELCAAVGRSVQPAAVGLWLRPDLGTGRAHGVAGIDR